MNVLFKIRYFRRECLTQTWVLSRFALYLPDKAWCLDYISYGKGITDFDIIWKLCELGDLWNLKKVKKSTSCKMMNIVLCSIYPNKLFYQNNENKTMKLIDVALIVSSCYGHLQVVQYLVKQGANIHADNDFALRGSAENGHLPVVQYLVSQGANIHACNDDASQWSAYNGHLPVLEYLVSQGANIHAYDDYALRWSAKYGHLPVVQYLVSHGANIHAGNDEALRLSAGNGHVPVVQYLVSHGANIHADNDEALR